MSQREGEADYKYEDYASEMATYRSIYSAGVNSDSRFLLFSSITGVK